MLEQLQTALSGAESPTERKRAGDKMGGATAA